MLSPSLLRPFLGRHLREELSLKHFRSVKAQQEGREDNDRSLEAANVANECHQSVDFAFVLEFLVGQCHLDDRLRLRKTKLWFGIGLGRFYFWTEKKVSGSGSL